MTSFYSEEELKSIGFKSFGKNVLISRKTSIYSPEKISIGNNVRIDDYCIISGDITIGNYIHIAAYCALFGSMGIEMKDYSGLSMRCTILSATDDYGGNYLIGPMMEEGTTNVTGGRVVIEKYATCGAHSLVMPNITIGEGAVTGAMSMVNKTLLPWGIYLGIPAKRIKDREKGLLKFV
ncbi:MAG: acyltransferase [Bacteroidales bacterium]|jgi:galactoside O-acetyltransferase|nr:acyltransferase [Bacteroidales bacterium]